LLRGVSDTRARPSACRTAAAVGAIRGWKLF